MNLITKYWNFLLYLKITFLSLQNGKSIPDTLGTEFTNPEGLAYGYTDVNQAARSGNRVLAILQDTDSSENGGAFFDTTIAYTRPGEDTIVTMRSK